MPDPIPVELQPHDSAWAEQAAREATRITHALGDEIIVAVHHVGSTAIPGIRAKPILDLIPVAASLQTLDAARPHLEAIGYVWWGEYGLPGRRYCTLVDRESGRRRIQLHCYERGSSAIDRHLAFRDYLRAHLTVARAYDVEKARCRDLHPGDSHAYTDCKDAWIRRVEQAALRSYRMARGF
jgi:GrpB-like predicted nucleotidyltransferase (UPF0157 family)